MVKGISRQVILVESPERALFEQAIFILKEDAVREGITDELLLKEARKVLREPEEKGRRGLLGSGLFWAAAGAGATGLLWGLTSLL